MALVSPFMAVDFLTVRAFGAALPVDGDPNHLEYPYFSAQVPLATVKAAVAAGESAVSGSNSTVFIAKMENKQVGADALYKLCPIAVRGATVAESTYFGCWDGIQDFAAGEIIQLSGNIALTGELGLVLASMGMKEPCNCWKNQSTPINCAGFDAQ